MTNKRGFFAVGIYHPRREVNVGSLWRSASIYGARLLFTIGRRYHNQSSDTINSPRHTPLIHFKDIDDAVEHLPDSTPLVGVEMDGSAIMLDKYTHFERAAYLFGAEDHGLPNEVMKRCHHLVQIRTPSEYPLNVANAGTVVLHDRYMKGLR